MDNKPSKAAIERATAILDNWLDLLGPCPLHIHQDADADECTCREEAQIMEVRDWLWVQIGKVF